MRATAKTPNGRQARVAKKTLALVAGASVLLALGVLLLMLCGAHMDALKAAGAFNGDAIGGVQQYADKLKGNVVWVGGTVMGLVIAVVGILFVVGHTRAHDIAIRTILGLAVLASVSGIVA